MVWYYQTCLPIISLTTMEDCMAHHWDTGFTVRTPSWHREERWVLPDGTLGWEQARELSGITWEVTSEPIYSVDDRGEYDQIEGWQSIYRDDRDWLQEGRVLAIQPSSYAVIKNAEFGRIINDVLGAQQDEEIVFESLMSLYGGKMIVALCYFAQPLTMAWDPSETYRYLAFCSRHDGQGGLRGIPTNVRVVCANTLNAAEAFDGRRVGFTVRHTATWEQKVEEIRSSLVISQRQGKKWTEFAELLARYPVTGQRRETFLRRMFPVSDDMTARMMTNAENNRQSVRMLLESPTCESIKGNGYGLYMATTEWSDHVRTARTRSSFVARQLLSKEEPKAKSARILRQMAGIKL